MPNIKTKSTIKNKKVPIKTSQISNAKDFLIKTKGNSEETQKSDFDNPHTYATELMSSKVKEISGSVAYKVERLGRRSIKKAPQTMQDAKTGAVRIKQKIRALANNTKIKETVKTVNKTTEKTVAKTAKTSKQTTQATIKTAQATARASQKAAQVAKATTKITVQTAKATAKAVIATIKATFAAVKGLITLIAAGGWIAVVIILIICMVAFLISSPLGLFYSDKKTDTNSITLSSAIEQISTSFTEEIERIKSENPHDEIDGITTPQNWRDVLLVYAVKTAADPNNPIEVATMNPAKLEILRTIFWDMNIISLTLETVETNDDSSKKKTKTILHITVQNKNFCEMAEQYGFSPEQNEQLNEMMNPNYDSMWDVLFD